MNIAIKRLDPHVPDPVESRRRAAGRLVRIAYATIVFGILGFFVVYFGAPLVFLSGPGTVSSARQVISFPYMVRVGRLTVARGDTVKAGDEIGQIGSPEQDNIVANYLRALEDISSRRAELRIKARVARESLEATREYLSLTEEAARRIEESSSSSLFFRVQIARERAAAYKAVVTQEAEAAESTAQLAGLDEINERISERLATVERSFAEGRVFAPIGGIISTNLANAGQSLVAGTPVAEVLDPAQVFVDWYIPNERLFDPKEGQEVFVLFGNRRVAARITEILPVSAIYAGTQPALTRERSATQIARIRFEPDAVPPPLNSTVQVRMYYSRLAAWTAAALVDLLRLN